MNPGPIALAGLALAGGLWATAIGRLIMREVSVPRPRPVVPEAAVYFAAALAVLVGATTFVSMTELPGANAWWTVLTLFVVVQPGYAASLGATVVATVVLVLGHRILPAGHRARRAPR
jgi:hypothetical protein